MVDFFRTAVAALALAASIGSASAQQKIYIGSPTVLSGPLAVIGQRGTNGLLMAIEDINAKGGLLGSQIELISADDHAAPATASTLTRGMILNNGIKAIFGSSSSATAAAEQILAGQFKVPFIIYGGNDISLTTTNFNRYTFQIQPSTYMEPRAAASYVAKFDYKRYYFISPDFSFGRTTVTNFQAGLKESGVQMVNLGEQFPALGSSDFSTFIAAALAAKPDVLFLGLFAGDLVTFIKQAKGYGLFEKMAVVMQPAMDALLTMKDEVPAGAIMYGRAPFIAINTPAVADMAERYFKRFNQWPSDWPLLAYAGAQIWADGVRKAGSFDGEKVAAALRGAKVTSILGEYTFRECDHQADAPIYIGKIGSKIDPRYGFPVFEEVTRIEGSKFFMTCEMAQSLQRK